MDKNNTIQVLIDSEKFVTYVSKDMPVRMKNRGPVMCPLEDFLRHEPPKHLRGEVQCFYSNAWRKMSLPQWEKQAVVITITLEVGSPRVADDIVNSVAAPDGEFIADINEFFCSAYGDAAFAITAIDADTL